MLKNKVITSALKKCYSLNQVLTATLTFYFLPPGWFIFYLLIVFFLILNPTKRSLQILVYIKSKQCN